MKKGFKRYWWVLALAFVLWSLGAMEFGMAYQTGGPVARSVAVFLVGYGLWAFGLWKVVDTMDADEEGRK